MVDSRDSSDVITLLLAVGVILWLVSRRESTTVFAGPVAASNTAPAFNIAGCPTGIPVNKSTTGGTRLEAQKIGPIANYEATWCGTASGGDELAFKFWGPNHTDQNCTGADCVGKATCCWCIMSVCKADGKFSMRAEGPHPNYKGNTCKGFVAGGTYQPLTTAGSCVKGVITQVAGGAHIEGYGLKAGKWVKYLDWTGKCGNSHVLTAPTVNADFVLRFSTLPHNTKCATVRPLGPKVAPGHPVAA